MSNLPEHLAAALERARSRSTASAADEAPLEDPNAYHDDIVTLEQVRRRRADARRRLYLRSVPARYERARLDDLAAAQHAAAVGAWLASNSPTLILAGAVGSGKTHAAFAVLAAALKQGRHVAAATVVDLLAASRPNADPSPLPRLAEEADIFLLDDVGTEKPTDWAIEQFGAVVDARTREGLRQVLTTNLTSEQMRARFGDRAVSRLSAGATVLRFEGPDRRLDLW